MSLPHHKRKDNMEHIASLSYGKDSLAMLEAIKILGLPLDRIVTAEVWATETVPAEFPEMVEFKKKADQIILDRYGIQVEHFRSQNTYDSVFHMTRKDTGRMYGFPIVKGSWCVSYLKTSVLKKLELPNTVKYLGIAADEPKRIARHSGNARLPLVEIGWDEAYCRKWCEENDLLSPIYILIPQEVDVSSAIIRDLNSCGYYERNTLICGR